ncbi:anti-phage deoxyguanosine triphosphatase [Acinetobacter sp. G11]|uniref:anti-phage deoxyguanosine triphosphatase n=1 Tax=Acinetobacter sp. G11 TaxID=3415989 RepID=UPI003C7B610C
MLDHNLLSERVNPDVSKDEDWNSISNDTPYQIDRARIIHSASFRRLQAKTQILGIGDSDFYRTRLTHSMEVAQLGFGITESLKARYKNDPLLLDLIPSQNAIESICLAHDIGHPAFGHGGEVALNYCMVNDGGFEGNGQTLRIVSKLAEYTPENGMNLTRRTLLGLIKYPVPFSKFKINYPSKELTKNLVLPLQLKDYQPPKCILDTEADLFTTWVSNIFSSNDLKKFMTINTEKRTKPKYTSFDSSIMELADDISYGIHDLEDAVALKLITEKQWRDQVVKKIENIKVELNNDLENITKLLFGSSNKERKHAISKLIRYFLKKVYIYKQNIFEHELLDYNVVLEDEENTEALEVIKDFVINNVIRQPEIQILDYKGQQIVVELFEVLSNNPNNLLPQSTLEQYKKAENKNRVICDYISGMTDAYASRLYHKLFTPNMGSVFDRL